MIKSLPISEEQGNLRIVEHLDMQKLPESLQQMISLASTPEEQDIILMATLAAASAYRMIDGDAQDVVPRQSTAFIEKLDDKVTKWQSSKRHNLLISSNFVNFATLSWEKLLSNDIRPNEHSF